MIILSFFTLMTFAADFGIPTGQQAPQIQTNDIHGSSFDLYKELEQRPVVLIFYRGGWCPYCNVQLRKIEKDIVSKMGEKIKVAAISVDRVDEGLLTKKKQEISMTLISDPMAKILKSYKLQFKVPSELVKMYKEKYQIDLEKSSGQKHHIISVPAVFVVAKDKTVRFSYSNVDYKVRAKNKDILKAIQSL